MNEEMTNFEEMENTEVSTINDDFETSGGGIAGKIVVGTLAVAAVGAGAALLCKNKVKTKIEERRIKKLEKKGYVVYKPDEVVDEPEDEYFDEEEVEETE